MMHACHLIASAIGRQSTINIPCEPVYNVCAVTGSYGPCIPKKLVIPPSNCDRFLFAAPQSNYVHINVFASWSFSEVKNGKKRGTYPERQSCWWCDGKEFKTVDKEFIRDVALNGSPSETWSMWVTTKYKKHGSIRSKVNHCARGCFGFDDDTIDCSDKSSVATAWEILREAQDAGVPRSVMYSLDASPSLIGKIGWRRWIRLESWARPMLHSGNYRFMIYILPSMKELNDDRR